MTLTKTVNLILKASNTNPYSGKLSKEDNYISAIELAELCKEFAENGQTDEAMDLDVNHWNEVISRLKIKSRK
jgi:hypothetical protein